MFYDVISSGSKGNCTIVYSKGTLIQIDFGISKRRVQKALSDLGHSLDDIQAVFVTHSHSDHCSDIASADVEKIYSSTPTLPKVEKVFSGEHLVRPFVTIKIGSLDITPIPLNHDAKNTVGYLIDDSEEKLAIITDTGFIPEKDFPYLSNLDYYVFESNHDPKMLYESKRPDYLIRRIISDKGHLSNEDSAYYLSILMGNKTKEVVLAHLSEECNTPEIAIDTFNKVVMTQLGYLPDIILKTGSVKHETRGGR